MWSPNADLNYSSLWRINNCFKEYCWKLMSQFFEMSLFLWYPSCNDLSVFWTAFAPIYSMFIHHSQFCYSDEIASESHTRGTEFCPIRLCRNGRRGESQTITIIVLHYLFHPVLSNFSMSMHGNNKCRYFTMPLLTRSSREYCLCSIHPHHVYQSV